MDQRVVFLEKKLLNLEAELNSIRVRQSEFHLRELQIQRNLSLNSIKLRFEQQNMIEKVNSLCARLSESHLRELRRQETSEEFAVNHTQEQSVEPMSSGQDSIIADRDEIDGKPLHQHMKYV